jgi:DMSO/TMAO reductase YedYZ molybdopterin-dependent catalytic subunit
VWAAGYLAAVYGGVKFINSRSQTMGTPWPLRLGYEGNGGLWGDLVDPDKPARQYSASQITPMRANGDYGLGDDYDVSTWSLSVEGVHGHDEPLELTMADIKKLPEHEIITEMCCIEGWSIIQRWKGVRLRDFMAKYPPPGSGGKPVDVEKHPEDLPQYLAMSTPDDGYFVGLDMASARHVQTLLCYEMNGQPLTLEHGAPLRLAIPVKYGIKNIKRIGKISYTDQRPRDYWAEQGYDWFAGL